MNDFPKSPKEYIQRSMDMHPSLLADALLGDVKTHNEFAAITYNIGAENSARKMGRACLLASEIVQTGHINQIMSELRLWIPTFHHAVRLNCMGQHERSIIAEFPSGS